MQTLKCRFCGNTREVFPSRNDPPELHLILSRCHDCYKAGHTDNIILEYYDQQGNPLPEPHDPLFP